MFDIIKRDGASTTLLLNQYYSKAMEWAIIGVVSRFSTPASILLSAGHKGKRLQDVVTLLAAEDDVGTELLRGSLRM